MEYFYFGLYVEWEQLFDQIFLYIMFMILEGLQSKVDICWTWYFLFFASNCVMCWQQTMHFLVGGCKSQMLTFDEKYGFNLTFFTFVCNLCDIFWISTKCVWRGQFGHLGNWLWYDRAMVNNVGFFCFFCFWAKGANVLLVDVQTARFHERNMT